MGRWRKTLGRCGDEKDGGRGRLLVGGTIETGKVKG
jgi:hypothetical protein